MIKSARATATTGRIQAFIDPAVKRLAIKQALNRGMSLTAYIEMLILKAPKKKRRS